METSSLESLHQKYRLKPGPCNYYMEWGQSGGAEPLTCVPWSSCEPRVYLLSDSHVLRHNLEDSRRATRGILMWKNKISPGKIKIHPKGKEGQEG